MNFKDRFLLPVTSRRRSKYNNQKTVVDGIVFASKLEAARYGELKILEKAGEIRHLECHPKWVYLADDGSTGFTYFADFAYYEGLRGNLVVEDVKGKITPEFKLKQRLIEPRFGFKIRIIRSYNAGLVTGND